MGSGNRAPNRGLFTCKHFIGDKFESIGKLASHVGSGISIWLVAVVINKDLNKNFNKLASAPY
jgi:hypothetical protein